MRSGSCGRIGSMAGPAWRGFTVSMMVRSGFRETLGLGERSEEILETGGEGAGDISLMSSVFFQWSCRLAFIRGAYRINFNTVLRPSTQPNQRTRRRLPRDSPFG